MQTIREKQLDQMVDILNQELADILLAKAEADVEIVKLKEELFEARLNTK